MLFDSELESIGRWTLGPLAAGFPIWIDSIKQIENDCLIFTSRDAKFLYQSYLRHSKVQEHAHYLPVSRAFLRRLTLQHPIVQESMCDSSFMGTAFEFLQGRLALTTQETSRLCGDLHIDPLTEYYLPDSADQALDLCQRAAVVMAARISNEAETVKDFLRHNIPSKQNVVIVDVGFAGSIQLMLELIHGQPLGGAYIATTETPYLPQGSRHGWLGENLGWKSSPLLTGSLALETLLQATEPQMQKWSRNNHTDIFEYGHMANAQVVHRDLNFIHSAAFLRADELRTLNVSVETIKELAHAGLFALTQHPRLLPSQLRHNYRIDDPLSGSLHPRPHWEVF